LFLYCSLDYVACPPISPFLCLFPFGPLGYPFSFFPGQNLYLVQGADFGPLAVFFHFPLIDFPFLLKCFFPFEILCPFHPFFTPAKPDPLWNPVIPSQVPSLSLSDNVPVFRRLFSGQIIFFVAALGEWYPRVLADPSPRTTSPPEFLLPPLLFALPL